MTSISFIDIIYVNICKCRMCIYMLKDVLELKMHDQNFGVH